MSHQSTYHPKTAFERWMDERLPIIRVASDFLTYPTPRNLNYLWTFGGILTFCLAIQILTGIVPSSGGSTTGPTRRRARCCGSWAS
jgi:ubiquinol-cytochrome c reductase cytochrome b subunit